MGENTHEDVYPFYAYDVASGLADTECMSGTAENLIASLRDHVSADAEFQAHAHSAGTLDDPWRDQ